VTPRAAAVKDGPLGPPLEAARSVLDGGEHGVTLAVVGTAVDLLGWPVGGAYVALRALDANQGLVSFRAQDAIVNNPYEENAHAVYINRNRCGIHSSCNSGHCRRSAELRGL
jgi:hypothetical protein